MPPEASPPGQGRTIAVRARGAGIALVIGLVVGVLVWPLVGLLSSWLRLPRSFEPMAVGLILIMIAAGVVVGWAWDPNADHGAGPPAA